MRMSACRLDLQMAVTGENIGRGALLSTPFRSKYQLLVLAALTKEVVACNGFMSSCV